MAKNLFVGSLPFSATEDSLRQLFSQYGEVQSVSIIIDRYSGQPRGFGFVEMSTDEQAKEAIEKLNGFQMEGRSLVVKEALPKPTFRAGNGPKNFGNKRKRY